MNRRLVFSALGCTLALAPLAARALPADASATARQLVRWATDTGDHQRLPFAVIDKPWARIHVFSAQGQWLGSAPVLLGAARGDRSAPDLGTRPLAQIGVSSFSVQ